MTEKNEPVERSAALWRGALRLALFTIIYNLAEGLVSIYFGIQDEALTLFGFGVDSFIEVISGAGILAMVLRIRHDRVGERSRFERAALRVTGAAFYLLAAGLLFSAAYNLAGARRPETTLPGLVIAFLSIAIMGFLVRAKRKAYVNFQGYSAPYRRIRVAYIDSARRRPAEFRKRLDNFLKLTAQGKQFGYGIESFFN